RRLPHLFGIGRRDRVLHDSFRAARQCTRGRRARSGRRAGRRAQERRPACGLHREGRDRIDAGAIHRHAARHLQAGHHGCGRRQVGWRRRLPRADAAREMPIAILDAAVHAMILGYLGAGALLAALVMGGFSALLSFWSGVRQSATFIHVGQRAFYAAAAMTLLSAVALEVALLTHDFSLAYVVEHTDLSTPTALVAAAFYGGQEGSLLYWTLILGI